jgi:5-methylcytosine-specific restriction endonuclease McrA
MKSPIEQECFRLVQQIVVARDKKCVRCGEPSSCGHHVFTRSRQATAFLPEACMGLCTECHNWIEAHPEQGVILAVSLLGRKRYDELERVSLTQCRFREADYRDIRRVLRKRLKEVEG